MVKSNIYIALVQEPYVGTTSNVSPVSGFDIFQASQANSRNRVAIFLSHLLGTKALMHTEFTSPDQCTISIKNKGKTIYLTSIYAAPDEDIQTTIKGIEAMLQGTRVSSHIICGDFNAHHTAWGSKASNKRGTDLYEAFATTLSIQNQGSQATFHAIRNGSQANSIVDITFTSLPLENFISGWNVDTQAKASGDHHVIRFDLNSFKPYQTSSRSTFKWNTKKVDWQAFDQALLEATAGLEQQKLDTAEQIERFTLSLNQAITKCCDTTIPAKKPHSKFNPIWSKELTEMKIEVLRAKHKLQENTWNREQAEIYTEKRKAYAQAIRQASIEHFRSYISLAPGEDVWEINRKIVKLKTQARPEATLRLADGFTKESSQTASALLDHFYPDDAPDEGGHSSIREASQAIPTAPPDPSIVPEEIEEAFQSMNPNKAPGLDGFTSDICTRLCQINPSILTLLFNSCLAIGYFPKPWKQATVKILAKPAKQDYTALSSFRPIGLLSVLGKGLEKIISKRLDYHLKAQLSPSQYGFTEQISTIDALSKATQAIKKAKSKAGNQVVLLSLDIKAAFDNAWWPSLRLGLLRLEAPSNIVRLIDSYLLDREVHLDYAEAKATKPTNRGCVQGSVLGPKFWNIIVDTYLKLPKPTGVEAQAFADDVILIIQDKNTSKLREKVSEALNQAMEWGKSVKLTFGMAKTQLIAFTEKARSLAIKIGKDTLKPQASLKLLGVVIDEYLRFNAHIRQAIAKANQAYKNLSRIARATWGAQAEILRTIYLRAIEPIVTYAAPIWHQAINKKGVLKLLNTFQRPYTIAASKAYRTASLASTQAIADIKPLDLRIREIVEIHKAKTEGKIPGIRKPIEIEAKLNPSLRPHPAKRITINFREITKESQAIEAQAGSTNSIFTDGSKTDDGVGFGLVAYKDQKEFFCKSYRLSDNCSVFQAELLAISEALQYGLKWRGSFSIFTDSKSSLEAIKQRTTKNPLVAKIHERIAQANEAKIMIRFNWVKAHIGIIGNERADSLAKKGTTQKKSPFYNKAPISLAKYKAKAKANEEWNQRYQKYIHDSADVGKHSIGYHLKSISEAQALYRVAKPNFYTTQAITGHGCFGSYLFRFKRREEATCQCEEEAEQTPAHCLEQCPLFEVHRRAFQAEASSNSFSVRSHIKTESSLKTLLLFLTEVIMSLARINGSTQASSEKPN